MRIEPAHKEVRCASTVSHDSADSTCTRINSTSAGTQLAIRSHKKSTSSPGATFASLSNQLATMTRHDTESGFNDMTPQEESMLGDAREASAVSKKMVTK